MTRGRPLGILAGFLLMLLSLPVSALHAIPVPQPEPRPLVGRQIAFDIFHDPRGSLDVTAVAARDDLDWRTGDTAYSRYGYGSIWIRIAPIADAEILSLSNVPDYAELYEPGPGGFDWRVQRVGDTIPLAERAYPAERPAFHLSPDIGNPGYRYLHIEQPNRLSFQLQVWHEPDFRAYLDRAQIIRILALGFCGAIILYNLVVSLLARDLIFAFNALTIASLVLLDSYLTGIGAYRIWPDAPWLSNIMLCLSIGFTVFFGSRFISLMLRDGRASSRLLAQVRWNGSGALLIALTAIFIPYWLTMIPLMLLAVGFVLLLLYHVVRLSLLGDARARLLLVPFTLAVVPGIALVMVNSWSGAQFGWLRGHILEFTLVFEALAFSLVLAARMRLHMTEAAGAKNALAELKQRAVERFTRLQDKERARIATDLHDSLGHSLALAGAQLEALQSSAELDDETSERVSHGLISLREAISETRRISHALHPTTLIHLDWRAALTTMVRDFAVSHDIDAQCEIDCTEERLDDAAQTHLLRLVQEALSNIAKHAQATRCRVRIEEVDGGIAVAIEDDGIGIAGLDDLRATREDEISLGLFSMRQRAAQLGADLVIANRARKGLGLYFTIAETKTPA